MLIKDFFQALSGKIKELEQAEFDNIAQIAEICAHSIEFGGVIHIHDTGHMLNSELIGRAGGLVGMTPFTFGLNVNNPNSFRDKETDKANLTSETIALALKRSNIRPGDVLFVGSVSGKSEQVVELVLQARKMGVITVAISAIAYSSKLDSLHPSSKRLYEAAEFAIDNHAPYGDSMLTLENLDAGVCPASGISAATIMWAITAGIVELLLERGITPTVYKSVNAPGGVEDVQTRQERYKQKGY